MFWELSRNVSDICQFTYFWHSTDSFISITLTLFLHYEFWHISETFPILNWHISDIVLNLIVFWHISDTFQTVFWQFLATDRFLTVFRQFSATDTFLTVFRQFSDTFLKFVGPTFNKSTEFFVWKITRIIMLLKLPQGQWPWLLTILPIIFICGSRSRSCRFSSS